MTTKTHILDKFAAVFSLLGARFSKADRLELEQAYLRVAIAAAIIGYAACVALATHSIGADVLLFLSAYLAAALAILLAVWALPAKSVARRLLGIALDVSAATSALWALGEGGVAIVGLYLFVILGNGFRYGRAYLHVSQALSIAALAFAMAKAPWWQEHLMIGFGLLQILLILPFYVSVLAEGLKVALWNAQHALEECRRNQGGGGSEQSGKASGR